jgi:hypothetical protein
MREHPSDHQVLGLAATGREVHMGKGLIIPLLRDELALPGLPVLVLDGVMRVRVR